MKIWGISAALLKTESNKMAKKDKEKTELEKLIKEYEKTDKSDQRHHGHHFVMIGIVAIVAVVGIISVFLILNAKNTGMALKPAQNTALELTVEEQKSCLLSIVELIHDCNSDSATSEDSCNNAPILTKICFGDSSAAE